MEQLTTTTEAIGRQHLPVKLIRPRADRVSLRQRLFDRLDALRHSPLLWLGAPAGSGKTTLISSYIAHRRLAHLWYRFDVRDADPASFFAHLREAAAAHTGSPVETLPLLTREYLTGVEVFTRGFFETLFAGLTPPALLVFDDFHELPEGAALHALLPAAFGAIPEGVNVVVLSRAMPPPPFVNLRARGQLALMDPDELNLRLEEALELAHLDRINPVPEALVTRFHGLTVGWVAGMILLMEHARTKHLAADALPPQARETLFDYFATQVLMGIDAQTRALLLLTAWMPQVTPDEAVALSGIDEAPARLEALARNNFFTTRLSDETACYQYHPLFQEFLRATAARHFTADKLAANKARAAAQLIARDHLEPAASLLMELGEWPSLAALVQRHGAAFMAQGRHRELLQWVEALPSPMLAEAPWLLFWKAMASMPTDREAGYAAFVAAYEGFFSRGDVTGAVHAWAGAVESLVMAVHDVARMDGWRRRLDDLIERYRIDEDSMLEATLAPLVVGICIVRGSRAIAIEKWIKAAQWAISQPIDATQRILASFALATYFHLSGQRERERHVLETQAAILKAHPVTPLGELTTKICQGMYASVDGEWDKCVALVEEGFQIARRTGIHHWTYCTLLLETETALIRGDTAAARSRFGRLEPYRQFARLMDVTYHQNQLGWLALLEGEPGEALRQQTIANELAEGLGQPVMLAETSFGLSQAWHAMGDEKKAMECLLRVRRIGEEYPSQALLVRCDLLAAFYHLEAGRTEPARSLLADALRRARAEGFSAFPWWVPATLARLFGFALENGIERELVHRTIRRFGLRPASPEHAGLEWPRPIRLRTLGPFVIEVNGRRITFSGKTQKKPLELLQTLISLGGRDVREERLAELLWHDADGDAAIRNLHTTLHRLRKLLGHDEAIEVRRSTFSIDPDACGLDTWALETLAAQVAKAGSDRVEPLSQRLLDLYRGDFLGGEADAPWMHGTRDRLRALALKCVENLGALAESASRLDLAVALYTRALAMELGAQQFWTRLMLCHGLRGEVEPLLALHRRMAGSSRASERADEAARIAAAVRAGDMDRLRSLVTAVAASYGRK